MLPIRSSYAGQSYKIYDGYNDAHIFVEDDGYENFYKALLSKNGVNIEKVFSKNGKDSVIQAATSCTDPKCVFIIDRDWDDILGIKYVLTNLVTLNRHSIESYLLEYSAFVSIVLSEYPKCDIDSVLSKNSFTDVIHNVSTDLRKLFEYFVTLQLNDTGIKGCSIKPGHFQQENRSCAPDKKKIEDYISLSPQTIPPQVEEYFSNDNLIQKGHGKYMLHYVWEGVRRHSRLRKIGTLQLMMRLAQLLNSSDLEKLLEDIKSKIPQS